MARNRILGSILLASGLLLIAACATQPASLSASEPTPLLEKKFQRAAKNYKQVQHEGQTLYCKREIGFASNIPGWRCLTEGQLRADVESYERRRNEVQRPVMPGAGKGGIG